ncbi:MAG: sulfotransferase [Deltaproteobacteria bacterium]|nr:sulfotransferase [Deltaproteobacteria bacterium]
MKYTFRLSRRSLTKQGENDPVVIVSGLPRCGTSMMMQMLAAGGIPIVTDHIRKPDQDNPRGYYEYEKVKQIKKDASWIKKCRGKTFKMVSALLYYLPQNERFKVIFMQRDMNEMLASQDAMLQRLERKTDDSSNAEMLDRFQKHIREVEKWLEEQKNIEVIYIRHNEVIQGPHECAKLVSRFLEDKLDTVRMAGVIEKPLYRNRRVTK